MSSSEEAFESADEGECNPQCDSPSPRYYSSETSSSKLDTFAVDDSFTSGIQESITSVTTDWGKSWDDEWPESIEEPASIHTEETGSCHAAQVVDAEPPIARLSPDNISEQQPKQRVPLRLEKKSSISKSSSSELKDNEIRVLDKLSLVATEKSKQEEGVWGFRSWGSSLLSCAASVTEFTNQVSQGIGMVMNTVESTLGVPSPEELVKTATNVEQPSLSKDTSSSTDQANDKPSCEDEDKSKGDEKRSSVRLLGGLTQVIESTGSVVISSGLDTLEIIGKKTMDIITEGDPGLRKKRSMFNLGRTSTSSEQPPSSSQRGSASVDSAMEESDSSDELDYNRYFEDQQGSSHLEALEMLSQQTSIKVQRLGSLEEVSVIRKLLEEGFVPIQEQDDSTGSDRGTFSDDIDLCLKEMSLDVGICGESLKSFRNKSWERLKAYEKAEPNLKEIHKLAIEVLATLTAKSIELIHKAGELILIKQNVDVYNFIDQLLRMAEVICQEISSIAMASVTVMNKKADKYNSESMNHAITSIFLEASNSKNQVQDGFMLLVPIMQLKYLEEAT